MDRRQQKTRKAIFIAFTDLLSAKDYHHITVGDIIDRADVGRATFYAHFETKDYLLKEFCEDLFCHIFDATVHDHYDHRHFFECDAPPSVFQHLFEHLQRNDHNLLRLLSCRNAALFMPYFKNSLRQLILTQLPLFEARKAPQLPDSFWIDHIVSTFIETTHWWMENDMQESPEIITDYFFSVV